MLGWLPHALSVGAGLSHLSSLLLASHRMTFLLPAACFAPLHGDAAPLPYRHGSAAAVLNVNYILCTNLIFSLLPASVPNRTMLPHCPTVMVVQNALADVRFSTNPLVLGFPHIRFYAGGGGQGQGPGSWEGACKGQGARGRGLLIGRRLAVGRGWRGKGLAVGQGAGSGAKDWQDSAAVAKVQAGVTAVRSAVRQAGRVWWHPGTTVVTAVVVTHNLLCGRLQLIPTLSLQAFQAQHNLQSQRFASQWFMFLCLLWIPHHACAQLLPCSPAGAPLVASNGQRLGAL